MFTERDFEQMASLGKNVGEVNGELARFEKGFPFIEIVRSASVGDGILRFSEDECLRYMETGEKSVSTVTKFVPASGAATRMFKDLFTGLDDLRSGREPGAKALSFIKDFRKFPFSAGYPGDCSDGRAVLEYVLEGDAEGRFFSLNYGNMPKGLVVFHGYEDGVRTAFEEHFVEGAMYATSSDGKVRMHFTVSPEYMSLFEKEYERLASKYEARFGCSYEVTFSVQNPATDTIAANPDNTPFRKGDGSLLFRPAGHGALLGNLNSVDSDIIMIKNIDNVVRESRLEPTVYWKKVLKGVLVDVRDTVYAYVRRLKGLVGANVCQNGCISASGAAVVSSASGVSASGVAAALHEFVEKELPSLEAFADRFLMYDCASLKAASEGNIEKYLCTLLALLDRPLRVCGMVKNEGAPGGGPFVVREKDGRLSLQILESSQIDMDNEEYVKALRSSTHFNPVDIVCCIKDCDGRKYDLSEYVDRDAGFISSKSYEGRELKALELPGLWNGSMSSWNTLFVEVPVSTFNPVKTVMDLLGR